MGWYVVDQFRDTDRRAAYCPEWGHATAEDSRTAIYTALYRAASAQWVMEGCQTHAITLLAQDQETERVWFWNGFGLAVVDAIRSLDPLGVPAPSDFCVRPAVSEDAELLAQLDAEHWSHYARPPILMVPHVPGDATAVRSFLSEAPNSIWLAMQGSHTMGFIRFESGSNGASDVVQANTTIAITGAYIRPDYRRRGAALALLDAALRDYASQGFERCAVDFESFNPEAASFWMKYFAPVCLSVIRVPECVAAP
jgi:ribosomal protein S18 acetylase RimI-like enzyme